MILKEEEEGESLYNQKWAIKRITNYNYVFTCREDEQCEGSDTLCLNIPEKKEKEETPTHIKKEE